MDTVTRPDELTCDLRAVDRDALVARTAAGREHPIITSWNRRGPQPVPRYVLDALKAAQEFSGPAEPDPLIVVLIAWGESALRLAAMTHPPGGPHARKGDR